jgi:hypothetical protein
MFERIYWYYRLCREFITGRCAECGCGFMGRIGSHPSLKKIKGCEICGRMTGKEIRSE